MQAVEDSQPVKAMKGSKIAKLGKCARVVLVLGSHLHLCGSIAYVDTN